MRPAIARFSAAEAIILTGIALLCALTGIVMVSDWPRTSTPASQAVAAFRSAAGW